tara:strand:+ start:2529 stop:2990 length:462 start_codon:yes stop_codon:yes gene_type:complete
MSQSKEMDRFMKRLKSATKGNEEISELILDTMTVVTNVILHALSKGIGKKPLDELSRELRIEIASKICADLDETIMPIYKALDGVSDASFDVTSLARHINAISDDMEMFVKSSTNDKGVQSIETSVGRRIDDIEEDFKDAMKSMMLENQVGKA